MWRLPDAPGKSSLSQRLRFAKQVGYFSSARDQLPASQEHLTLLKTASLLIVAADNKIIPG